MKVTKDAIIDEAIAILEEKGDDPDEREHRGDEREEDRADAAAAEQQDG